MRAVSIRLAVCAAGFAVAPGATSLATAAFTDFTNWSLVEDPPNALFSGSATPGSATFFAGDGGVPVGTDIGYQSVNGLSPGSSTAGYAFDPSMSFTIAIDYAITFTGNPEGYLSLGFGVGEDGDGMNSAGMAMTTFDGAPFLVYGAGARVNDVDQPALPLALASAASGSLFVSYDAATGDVELGASTMQGAANPEASGTYAGLQDQWAGTELLASFFIRSGPIEPWSGGGAAEAAFSNLRILEGEAKFIPGPGVVSVMMLAMMAGSSRRRRGRSPALATLRQ